MLLRSYKSSNGCGIIRERKIWGKPKTNFIEIVNKKQNVKSMKLVSLTGFNIVTYGLYMTMNKFFYSDFNDTGCNAWYNSIHVICLKQ